MRIAISIIGVLASLVLLAASAFMNYLFMASLGQGELESRVLGAASVGADVLKSVLPFFMAWALAAVIPCIQWTTNMYNGEWLGRGGERGGLRRRS